MIDGLLNNVYANLTLDDLRSLVPKGKSSTWMHTTALVLTVINDTVDAAVQSLFNGRQHWFLLSTQFFPAS